ncbi:MAG: PspC domain-containing protein [bacterium]|nr:PspC domain-containing protein [Bacillota bacterium]HHW54355.1 PspC domain-containing protein [Bacillota bacterium]
MQKKLYRSKEQRMLAGVCGGLAEYLDLDVTILRLALAFIIFFTGIFPGLLFYFIAALIIPARP